MSVIGFKNFALEEAKKILGVKKPKSISKGIAPVQPHKGAGRNIHKNKKRKSTNKK